MLGEIARFEERLQDVRRDCKILGEVARCEDRLQDVRIPEDQNRAIKGF